MTYRIAAGALLTGSLLVGGCSDSPSAPVDPGEGPSSLVEVSISPATSTVSPGGTIQFVATGRMSDGSTQPVTATWSATGGQISSAGLYTAGAQQGSFRVVATSGTRSDTAAAVVAAVPGTSYQVHAGDDWRRYTGMDQVRAAGRFWWFRTEDVYNEVSLVPDATFGQVARITFRKSDETGWAPKIDHSFAPLDRAWYRFRMRYSPNWTTVGPAPAGYANSYKVTFWLWDGMEGRGQIELSNTNEYILGFRVTNPDGSTVRYSETALPGSTSFGKVTTEWTDNQWWEFVIYYEKTGANTARQHWWRRRLTQGGAVVNNPWTYTGIAVSGAPTPRVRAITLGSTRNKTTPETMYIYWGPYEIVDGSRHPNPWNMPLP